MESIYKLPLVLTPQPEGGYTVTCPLLPELITEGNSAREALDNANDALAALLAGYQELGRELPPALRPAEATAPIWVETALVLS